MRGRWPATVAALLDAAGGLLGDGPRAEPPAGPLRSADGPPEPDRAVRRDARFTDPYNQSALIDEYCEDEARPADERAYALVYKRLREMDVPEWMAPIIAAAPATSRSSGRWRSAASCGTRRATR